MYAEILKIRFWLNATCQRRLNAGTAGVTHSVQVYKFSMLFLLVNVHYLRVVAAQSCANNKLGVLSIYE